MYRSDTIRVSFGITSIVREVPKAGVCRASYLQEEHTLKSKSGARLERTDGGLYNDGY